MKRQVTTDGILENDYERMVPEFHKGTLIYAEHITRYQCVQDAIKDKIVLDIASGSGYGTKLLAENAKQVIGVDINKEAVEYSKKNFSGKNITYILGDGTSIPLEDDSVDVVVTFETIEHIQDYKQFLKEVSRVLKPDGLAIISTPNDLEFAEGNHFHIHEFTYDELISLLSGYFKNFKSYFQSTWKYVAVGEASDMENEVVIPQRLQNLAPKLPKEHLYFFILCSNRKIVEKIETVAAIGEHYSDRQLTERESNHKTKDLEKKAHIKELLLQIEHYQDQFRQEHAYRVHIEEELSKIRNTKGYKAYVKMRAVKNKIINYKDKDDREENT